MRAVQPGVSRRLSASVTGAFARAGSGSLSGREISAPYAGADLAAVVRAHSAVRTVRKRRQGAIGRAGRSERRTGRDMRLVARATLAALILNGCAAPSRRRRGIPAGNARRVLRPQARPDRLLIRRSGPRPQCRVVSDASRLHRRTDRSAICALATRRRAHAYDLRRDVEGSLRVPSALAAELVLSPERRRGVAKKAIETPWAKPRKGRDA